jgi:DNA-binding PadR family transcriptional regulator
MNWTAQDEHRGERVRHHRGRGPWGGGPGGFGGPAFGGVGFGGPPFMPPWFAGGGRGRPRPRRGDVRLAVLTLLAEQPMHGYQIITEMSSRSGGVWTPSPGSVYPTLQQLEDEGLVTVDEQDGRRTFALTDAGRAEVTRASEGRAAPWEGMAAHAEADTGGLRGGAMQLMAAAMQVAATGSPEQIARAERLLADARRSLYRMLAEDDGADADGGAS